MVNQHISGLGVGLLNRIAARVLVDKYDYHKMPVMPVLKDYDVSYPVVFGNRGMLKTVRGSFGMIISIRF